MSDRFLFTSFALVGTLLIAGFLFGCGTMFASGMAILFLIGGAVLVQLAHASGWNEPIPSDNVQVQDPRVKELVWPDVTIGVLPPGDLLICGNPRSSPADNRPE